MSLRAPESFKDKLDTSDLRLVCREKRHRGGQCSQCACCVSTLPPLLLIINVSREKSLFFPFVWTTRENCWHFSAATQPKHYWRAVAAADVELLLLIIARIFSLTIITDQWKGKKITWESQYLVLLLMLTWSPVFSGCPVEMFLSSAITKMPLPVSS